MTRESLDFIAYVVIGLMILCALSYFVRSWLDHSDDSLNRHKELMKEIDRHSGKE
jgi:hypothetical protein